jgi:aspartate/methionine/tyrosine aminotransferase
MILTHFPPMGVYETLFRFADVTHAYLGDAGTRPWAQGFPLTQPVPGGPSLPTSIAFTHDDMRYPSATGHDALRDRIAAYYRETYGAKVARENVAVFAGGRPAIWAVLAFLTKGVKVAIEETEYTPYWDALQILGHAPHIVPSNPGNRFRPTAKDYDAAAKSAARVLFVKSNPCNPTGVTATGAELERLVKTFTTGGHGAIFDEAYEFFHTTPDSALRYIGDIDATNAFVIGAATKGLQVPGARIGWAIASREHIELFRNFSSIAMGGVSRPSQLMVAELLESKRVKAARAAMGAFYDAQRAKFGEVLTRLGMKLYTGDGGFYHWGELPGTITADAFNEILFADKAAILPGRLCDMHRRRGANAPHERYMRFSFGPLTPESFAGDVKILERAFARV